MALKDNLTATAIKLINKFGNSVVLTEVVIDNSQYSPITGTIPKVSTDHNIKAYISDLYTAKQIANISTSDLETGLFGIDDFNAKFVFDGTVKKNWLVGGATIISLKTTTIQDGIIVWDAICRK